MAATYSQMKNALDEIARKNDEYRKQLGVSRAKLASAYSGLDSMLSDYTQIVSEIETAFTNNPDDLAYEILKVEKDKLVADFQSLKTYANNLITAFDGVVE